MTAVKHLSLLAKERMTAISERSPPRWQSHHEESPAGMTATRVPLRAEAISRSLLGSQPLVDELPASTSTSEPHGGIPV